MGSPNTIPPLVSPRTEGGMNENLSAIGDRAIDGGGPLPNQSSVGPAERLVDIALLECGPLLTFSPVPRVHSPVAIQEEGMTYLS